MLSRFSYFWFEVSGFSSGQLLLVFVSGLVLSPFPRYLVILSALRLGLSGFPGRVICLSLALLLALVQMEPLLAKIEAKGSEMARGRVGLNVEERRKLLEFCEEEWRVFVERVTQPSVRDRFQKVQLSSQSSEAEWGRRGVAFLVSEMERAFRIALVLILPLLIIDLLCATALGALGIELSVEYISFPLKLCLVLSTSGWALITQNLLVSYG